MKNKPAKIPTILGLLVLVVGVVVGVIATQYQAIFRLGAQSDTTPQDVRITNITGDSATISWVTDKPTAGIVLWGTSPGLGQSTVGNDAGIKQVHFVTISNLAANTTYYFKINSATTVSDNAGSPWQFLTQSQTGPSSNFQVISGTILTPDGLPAVDAVVYLTADGLPALSGQTSESGNWLISMPNVVANTAMQLFVQGGPLGVASAQIRSDAADPVPPITLGQTYDFRDAPPSSTNQPPEASIDLPEQEEIDLDSGFDFLGEDATGSATTSNSVTLESIDEGEIITTQEPEFFGEAPPGLSLTILVESDPITDSLVVPGNGVWKWSPPTDLPEGVHTVTLSWRDANGILRKLTRSFVVSAQEGAAFESTPSATPSQTPRPTATPTPTPTATPQASATPTASASATPTSSASASPRISIPSTDSGTPVAGSLTPTFMLSIMGIGLFVAAFFVSRKAT